MNSAWKIITVLSSLVLLGAAILGFLDKDYLKQEETTLAKQVAIQQKANSTKGLADRFKDAQDGYLVQYTDDKRQAEEDTDDANIETGEVKAKTVRTQRDSDLLAQQIKGIEDKLKDYENIDALVAAADKLTSDVAETETTLDSRKNHLVFVTDTIAETKGDIKGYRKLVARQNKGELAHNWKAHVTSYNSDWKFIVLDKGNYNATYPGAIVNIERGGEVIGQARITNVEQNRSAATLIAESFTGNDHPLPGDHVLSTTEAPEIVDLTQDTEDGGLDLDLDDNLETDATDDELDMLIPDSDDAF